MAITTISQNDVQEQVERQVVPPPGQDQAINAPQAGPSQEAKEEEEEEEDSDDEDKNEVNQHLEEPANVTTIPKPEEPGPS
jgi:ribosomal protein L12E/L44/L45/RPP1/RPP2